jgi:hypothetical protein
MKRYGVCFTALMVVAISAACFGDVHEVYTGSNEHIERVTFGTPVVEQISTLGSNMPGIAYHQNKIYWSRYYEDMVCCANADGTSVQELITGTARPRDLQIDTVNQKLYWLSSNTIYRANLDGSDIESVFRPGVGNITSFYVHVPSSKVYWIEYDPLSHDRAIQRSNLDGSVIEDITPSGLILGPSALQTSSIAVTSDAVYFSGDMFEANLLYRMNLDGTNPTAIRTTGDFVTNVIVNESDGTMYWSSIESGYPQKSKIYRSSTTGTYDKLMVSYDYSFIVRFTQGTNALYWTLETGVFKIDLLPSQIIADVTQEIADIKSIFTANEYVGSVYWSEMDGVSDFPNLTAGTGAIYQVNSDGSSQTTIHSGLNSVLGIEVDAENNYLYWADLLGGAIQRSHLDGSNSETLIADAGIPIMLALDKTRNILYWNTYLTGEIKSYDLTTQAVATVTTSASDSGCLAVDSTTNKIYFRSGDIARINPDGTEKEYISSFASHLAVDTTAEYLYMIRNGTLHFVDINNPTEDVGIDQISGDYLTLRTEPPQSLTIIGSRYAALGAHVILRVGGLPALVGNVTYEWYRDGALIPGAVTDTYEIASAGYEHSGTYHVMVTDESKGIFMSSPFVLIVTDSPLPAANLIMLGMLTLVLTGLGAKNIRKRN